MPTPPTPSAPNAVTPPLRARRILAHFGLRAELVLSRLDGSCPTADEVALVSAAIAALDDLEASADRASSSGVRPASKTG